MAVHTKKHMPIRKFNKAIYNRLAKLIAGKFLYALIEHKGRKTGKAYSTPVLAGLHEGYFFTPLPYGADTDWFLNIMAAGGGKLHYQRQVYLVSHPQLLELDEPPECFSPNNRKALKRAGVRQYLRLQLG